MSLRAPFGCSLLLLVVLSLLATAGQAQLRGAFYDGSYPDRTNHASGVLEGSVLTADGQPASGVRIELRGSSSPAAAMSVYSQTDGSFTLYNLPPGNYEVVALQGSSRVSQEVSIGSASANVNLRLPATADSGSSGAAKVSVAEMLVPHKARSLYQKAQESYSKAKVEDAQKQLARALEIYPHFGEALTLRAILEMPTDIAQAQRDLEQAVQYDPDYPLTYVALAAVYSNQKRFDDALRSADRSVTLAPNSWQGYFEMAKAWIAKGVYDKGLQSANKAASLAPRGFSPLHLLKAYALIPLRAYKQAQAELEAFLTGEPKGAGAVTAQKLLAEVKTAEQQQVGAPQSLEDTLLSGGH